MDRPARIQVEPRLVLLHDRDLAVPAAVRTIGRISPESAYSSSAAYAA